MGNLKNIRNILLNKRKFLYLKFYYFLTGNKRMKLDYYAVLDDICT